MKANTEAKRLIFPRRTNIFSIIGVLLVCLLIAPASAAAATYYVATTGSDSNSGSSASPFKTIQKAAGLVNPGDTVIVKDGVYTKPSGNSVGVVELSRGGSTNSYVTFKSENPWGAVLDGQSFTTHDGFTFYTGVNWVWIEGFEIRNTLNNGCNASSYNNYIYYYLNHVHNIGNVVTSDDQGKAGFYTNGTYHTVDSNVIHDIGRSPGSQYAYTNDHGIYYGGHDHTISNNKFYNCLAGWSIQIASCSNLQILNNTFAFTNTGATGHIVLWGSTGSTMSNIKIDGNVSLYPTGSFVYIYYAPLSSTVISNNCTTASAVTSGTSSSGFTLSNNKTSIN
jgi:hypothetical protein